MIIHSAQDVQKIIKSVGVESALRANIASLKEAFAHINQYDVRPRVGYHNSQGVFDVMPVLSERYFVFKYVNCHPANLMMGMPTIMGVYVLVDAQTGAPLLIADAAILTALRTAAMQALACQVVRLHHPKVMGLIGCGAQAEFLISALCQVLDLDKVVLCDSDVAAAEKCQSHLGTKLNVVIGSMEQVLKESEVLVTATAANTHNKLFQQLPSQLQMILAVGGDTSGKTELDPAVINQCQIMVELLEQAKVEGEIQQLKNHNKVSEISKIIHNPLDSRDGCILFDSVGIALEDMVVLEWYYKLCDLGSAVPFCEQPENPKDLFGQVVS